MLGHLLNALFFKSFSLHFHQFNRIPSVNIHNSNFLFSKNVIENVLSRVFCKLILTKTFQQYNKSTFFIETERTKKFSEEEKQNKKFVAKT